MAVRNIVKIDEEKCNGCGQCVTACAEGAIKIINGKARLVSETYCDGLGACLGHCPQDAISIEQRDAAEFDEEATKAYLAQEKKADVPFACPGLALHQFDVAEEKEPGSAPEAEEVPSQLGHWPVQLKLVSPAAPYFADADLLLVADCVPVAMADFHQRFLKGRSVAMGCPKLDDAQYYVEKLADILRSNTVRSLTVVHMQVPCCSGLTRVAQLALSQAGKDLLAEDVTIGLRGEVLRKEPLQGQPASAR
jgi:Fe-S-cluster-containing hydrogenase component 2